jgi:hypothetical protein
MKKKLEINIEGGIVTQEQQSEIVVFLSHYAEKHVAAEFKVIDKAHYWCHKYYRGYLLPDIIDCWGEPNSHFELKKMFLMYDIYSFEDVQSHHRKNCNIVIDSENNPIACIPSLSTLTVDEFIKFIKDCELFLFDTIQGCISPHHQVKAKETRDMIGI